MLILKYIWLILFFGWGLPLTYYRSKFRKIVYQTDSWLINIKPLFWKELKALFGNIYPENKEYIRFRNFYRFYLTIYLLLFILYFTIGSDAQTNKSTEMKKIEVGTNVPSFSLKDQNGNQFDINSVLGKKNLVIYFYPKDDSPGCTKEACYFRDQFEVFNDADALIIGISGQSVESHKKFAEKYRLSYTLLSDEGNKIRNLFGVPTNFFGLLPGRVTYIVDKTGKVIYIFDSQIQATQHVDEALKILKELK
ncbi:MAG: peroxiredoxin [Tenuifilaceae bacterium]